MLSPPERLKDRISQLIFPRLGSNMSPNISVEDDAARIEQLLDEYPVGGLCLFNGDRIRTPQTLTRLQSRSRFPLLIGTDMERGLGQQLRGATVFPHAMAFQATGEGEDENLLEQSARAAAREALAAGLHISFSPVADINSNPRNPIISTRAYGSTPQTVSRLLKAYIRGSGGEGLFTTAKHFPGHGDTDVDSHEALPVVTRSRAEMEGLELAPFREAVNAGVSLMMTAHVSYPGLDSSGVEATRSKPILTDLLRQDLGFRGAVISDSLLMAGADHEGEHPGEMAATLLRAGVDILLDIKDVGAVVDYLVNLVETGKLDKKVIDTALQRVWSLKARFAARFGPGAFIDPSLAQPYSIIGCDAHRALAMEVAEKSIQVAIGKEQDLVLRKPGLGQYGTACILVRPHTTYNDPTAAPLERAFLGSFTDGAFFQVLPDTQDNELEDLMEKLDSFANVIVAVVVKPAAWHKFGLLPGQAAFVRDVSTKFPIFLVALGSPIVLADFDKIQVGICAYSDVEPTMLALVKYLKSLEADVPRTFNTSV
jgi:beta-N-acetylhexosaminidase